MSHHHNLLIMEDLNAQIRKDQSAYGKWTDTGTIMCTFVPKAIKKKVTLTLFKDIHKIIWISSEHRLNASQLSWSVEHFAEYCGIDR